MIALGIGLLLVPLLDQAVKALALRLAVSVPLGPLGRLQPMRSRIWLVCVRWNLALMWSVWIVAAGLLAVLASVVPECGWSAGLLLGGSLSHALETSLRGCVIDYVRLRFWPAFNLADVAITVGAAGVLIQMLSAIVEVRA